MGLDSRINLLPGNLMASKTQPNYYPNDKVEFGINLENRKKFQKVFTPFAKPFVDEFQKEFFSLNKMNKAVDVLPNGNVAMENGNIVMGNQIAAAAQQSNQTAVPIEAQANGMVKMSNGNMINKNVPNRNGSPVAVDSNGNVVLSNGDVVASNVINSLPQHTPNSVNTGNMGNSGCPISPPTEPMRYCRPAPFHSENGQKYFYVPEAYGTPMVGRSMMGM